MQTKYHKTTRFLEVMGDTPIILWKYDSMPSQGMRMLIEFVDSGSNKHANRERTIYTDSGQQTPTG